MTAPGKTRKLAGAAGRLAQSARGKPFGRRTWVRAGGLCAQSAPGPRKRAPCMPRRVSSPSPGTSFGTRKDVRQAGGLKAQRHIQ